MSGHNKWSTIKHKKAAKDAKRARLWTRLIKEVTVAARMGGGDADANPRLRLAVGKAQAANMPKDNIERAIKKGTGELEGVEYVEMTYEGYGPEGVAVLVQALTDNTNRTIAEVRHTFGKKGGKIGEPGSVAWMFQEKGLIEVDKGELTFEEVFELALEAGAEDVQDGDERWHVITAREDLYDVEAAIVKGGTEVAEAGLSMFPDTTIELTDLKTAEKVVALIDALEDNDDVQNVYANFDITDEIAAQLEDDD